VIVSGFVAIGDGAFATTWYVDVVNGSDTYLGINAGQRPTTPFKTITFALNHGLTPNIPTLAPGDEIYVAPGTYDVNSGESFPLTSTVTNIAIYGSSATRPVIKASGFTFNSPPSGVAAVFEPADRWVLSGLEIDNSAYLKGPGTAVPYNHIFGVYIENLGTSFAARNLRLFENYWGIWIADHAPQAAARTVTISDSVFEGQGMTIAKPLFPNDVGHAALVVAADSTLTATITNCSFIDNHDGIEGGQSHVIGTNKPDPLNRAQIVVTQCLFKNNENGCECNDNVMFIEGCTFETNQRRDPQFEGGVANHFTLALGNRSSGQDTRYTVRRCTFDRNQIAFGLFGGPQVGNVGSAPIVFDLGVSGDPGNNAFLTDIQVPWPNTYNESFCGVWTNHPNPVFAVGNYWTYDVSGNGAPPLDHNQGVVLVAGKGVYALGGPTSLGPMVNIDPGPFPPPPTTTPPNSPKYRPQTLPNVPWNVSAGPSTGTLGGPVIVVQ
jgi:hypothetical protein